jgi:hypothetical protein
MNSATTCWQTVSSPPQPSQKGAKALELGPTSWAVTQWEYTSYQFHTTAEDATRTSMLSVSPCYWRSRSHWVACHSKHGQPTSVAICSCLTFATTRSAPSMCTCSSRRWLRIRCATPAGEKLNFQGDAVRATLSAVCTTVLLQTTRRRTK